MFRYLNSIILLIVIFLSCISTLYANQKITIYGQIYGADGNIPEMAHVYLTKIYQYNYLNPLQEKQADSKGRLQLIVNKPGLYKLWIGAVNHPITVLPIYINTEKARVEFEITLCPYTNLTSMNEVKIFGNWNNFDLRKAEKMKKQSDGTYIYELDSEKELISYQLIGIEKDRLITGTMSDSYIYDGRGGYRSVLHVKPGKTTIIFEPSKMYLNKPNNKASYVYYNDSFKYLETVFDIMERFNKTQNKYNNAVQRYRENNGSLKGFTFNTLEECTFFEKVMREDNELIVRQFAAIYLLQLLKMNLTYNSNKIQEIHKVLPVDSIVWSIAPDTISMIGNVFKKEEYHNLMQDFYSENPSRIVQAFALVNLVREMTKLGDEINVNKYYRNLKDKYNDIKEIQYDLMKLNPNKNIVIGKKIPEFEIKPINEKTIISNKSLLGKYYLLDFWASWCKGCLDEIPHLQNAYSKYKKNDLNIISFSLDENIDTLKTFLSNNELPWQHYFIEDSFTNELIETFEVNHLPMLILVGSDGTIISYDSELRDQGLESVLDKVFNRK